MCIVQVKNLFYTYDEGAEVLYNINLEIAEASITAIIGLSGCGKTTLCHSLCGIIPQILGGRLIGKILFEGQDIAQYSLAELASRVGLVMQNPSQQLVTTTVEDELAFAPENLCLAPAEIKKRVEKVLSLLNLQSLRLENPNRLSGGEQQLVAIASVLTLQPSVLVLDEPMSHLDEAGKAIIQKALLLLKEQGKTIIMVEHDLKAAVFAENWLIISKGIVVRQASPEVILADENFLLAENLY